MKFPGVFKIQTYIDQEDKSGTTSLISTMIIVALFVLPVFFVFRMMNEPRLYTADFMIMILFVTFFVYYLLLRKGMTELVNILLLITSWISLTIMAAASAGIHDITIMGYILIIFVAVLLTGYRLAIIMSITSIIAVWLMTFAEIKGILVPPPDPPLPYARDFTLIFVMVFTAILLFERNFRNSYMKINKELQERIKAEEKLSQNEKRLIDKNEELTAAKLKAEESDRLKTSFLHNISHEIRTPLNGIVGFAELLRSPEYTAEQKEEYFRVMLNCTDQLTAVINDLIDISKIEAGVVEINPSSFRLDDLLDAAKLLFSASAAEKNILLKFENTLSGAVIRTDRGKMNQVLNNLLSNAIKFSSGGTVMIKVTRSDNELVISVSDTGIGIDEKDLPHIFDRFRQTEIGFSRSFGGTGLGLAICKGNLESLGGSITVRSEKEKGTEFIFSVPVTFLDNDAVREKIVSKFRSTRRARILLAEDDDISYMYLNNILKTGNFEIIRATDGNQAISLFENEKDINLVLLDLKLPLVDGFEVARLIRKKSGTVPIIAISAYAFEEDKKRAAEEGINDYLTKPVNKDELVDKISRFIIRHPKNI